METTDHKEEQTFAVFALPEDYAYHIGQVASIGSDGLRVVRRQLSIKSPYKLEVVPTRSISRVEYDSGLAHVRIVAGVLVLVLLVGIFYYLGVYWDRLEPGTTVRYGLLALAGIYGLKWAFMSRRHQLTFHLRDGGRVRWRSRSGDFKYKAPVAARAVGHLTELGLLASKTKQGLG
ncbi:hypothetical protein J2W24_002149 [Variovorax boronicumulans]|uniref:hypothetical protein n=1 Tax=Variovorax boronicumulans TaxID=436515 RepID=UPI0027807E4F|nr:hypothetical protein [Variovorax boronicumulans]MDP9916502.1 hypothetical protein [Variovorax boronicumulans]